MPVSSSNNKNRIILFIIIVPAVPAPTQPHLMDITLLKSRCEVPMRFTPGWHSGDAGVCLWAVHGATELRMFTVVAFCAAWNGGGVVL